MSLVHSLARELRSTRRDGLTFKKEECGGFRWGAQLPRAEAAGMKLWEGGEINPGA